MAERCYHQSVTQYDECENEETGEIIYGDFEVCKECKAVLVNDEIMGYDT